jgi:Ca2+/H+ antiporter
VLLHVGQESELQAEEKEVAFRVGEGVGALLLAVIALVPFELSIIS